MAKLGAPLIHTIGDSHAVTPYDRFLPPSQIHYYVGITMKRLGYPEEGALHQWVAEAHAQTGDALIMVCGEIDIRVWAHVHERERNKDPRVFLVDWVERYLEKVKTSPANGARLCVQSIAPPGSALRIEKLGRGWPVNGADAARAEYAAIANAALENGCRVRELTYLDVYSRYVGADGMIDPARTDDDVHITEPTALRELLAEQGLL